MQLNNDELNAKLTQYKNECGCATGSKFMAITFVSYLIFAIYQYGIFSIGFLKHLPLLILIPIFAAGLGKATGIAYARYKYRQLSKQLISSQSI